jgi:uncharacterized membrane protein
MPIRSWTTPALALAILLALLVGGPAFAHAGHHHAAQPAASSAAAASDATGQAPPMSSMEMTWPTSTDGGMMMDEKPKPTTFGGRLVAWLGAWHPAVIHFPIALLLTVAFLEIAAAVRRKPIYNAGNKLLLALAVLGAFVAAPLGWADAGLPTPKDDAALTVHRWIGTTIPFLILLLWRLKRPAETAAVRPSSRLYEVLLGASVLVILIQAYLGGEITHGHNHMAF